MKDGSLPTVLIAPQDPGFSLQVFLFVYTKTLVILKGGGAGHDFALKTDAKYPHPSILII